MKVVPQPWALYFWNFSQHCSIMSRYSCGEQHTSLSSWEGQYRAKAKMSALFFTTSSTRAGMSR